ncbi:MAG: mandelate racemase/muconate lactonizing enzyme family protein [Candidatus Latescibacteria bacterium]|nr:mandelate racemase/muconate lactonizing enzyme family protein [Candidatus Latescibacterota bacterium]
MTITNFQTLVLAAPLKKPMGGISHSGPVYSRKTALIQVMTDEGLVGLGESFGIPELVPPIVQHVFRPLLIGQDALDTEGLWDRMYRGLGYHGQKGLLVEVLSGIDIALWDLRGKAVGQPIYKLLGETHRTTLPAYAAGMYFSQVDNLRAEARSYVEQSFSAVKLKIGVGNKVPDEVAVRTVRETVGPDVRVMADLNCGYDYEKALEAGKKLEPYDLHWLEEPVPPEYLEDYHRLRQTLTMKIAGGEAEYTRWGFKAMFEKEAVDVAQPDLMRCGGLTEGRRIAQLAAEYGVPVSTHAWLSIVGMVASLHYGAACPLFESFEFEMTENPLRDDITVQKLRAERSQVKVFEGPGLGLDLIDEQVARYLVMKG